MKRRLHRKELRLFLFAESPENDRPADNRRLHVVRETLNGHKVPACTEAGRLLENDHNYWSFPFLGWFLNGGMVCVDCLHVLGEQGVVSYDLIWKRWTIEN